MFYAYLAKTKNEKELQKGLLDALEFIHWKDYLKSDTTVFVKPNFTFPKYRKGITTSPVLLKNLLKILKNRSRRVILGESDGGYRSFRAEEGFKGHGAHHFCKELGVELVNLSKLPSRVVKSKIQGRIIKVILPEFLLNDVECTLSVPVLKVHVMTKLSLSIKNLWGCFPNNMRILHHKQLDRKLALIAKMLTPVIVVIDGLYALDKHGPLLGEPLKTDLILASNNIVVADALGASIMGMNPREIKHIVSAEKEGIGTTDLTKVTINTNWRVFERRFTIKKTIVDRLSIIPFNNTIMAKVIYTSSATPIIYKVVNLLKTPEEKMVWIQK